MQFLLHLYPFEKSRKFSVGEKSSLGGAKLIKKKQKYVTFQMFMCLISN